MKMTPKHLIILILFFFSNSIFATQQIEDFVFYKGKKYKTIDFPLNQHMKENENLYKAWWSKPPCTAAWNWHQAYWLIIKGELLLSKIIYDPCTKKIDTPLTNFFPESKGNIKAKWFNGTIIIFTRGEKELKINIIKGNVMSVENK